MAQSWLQSQLPFLVVVRNEGSKPAEDSTKYPEVHYVFEDDDLDLSLDQDDNEVSLVVDFDKSGITPKVVRSLSSNWQSTCVSCTTSGAPSWAVGHDLNDTNALVIHGVHKSDPVSQQPLMDLIQDFERKNDQIKRMLDLQ